MLPNDQNRIVRITKRWAVFSDTFHTRNKAIIWKGSKRKDKKNIYKNYDEVKWF
jgi:hypothetical protein